MASGGHGVGGTRIRYRLLGRVEIGTDATFAPVTGRARQRLLAVLLLHRSRPVPSSGLAELLWGEEPSVDPAAALRSQMARLRQVLGRYRGDLVSVDGCYAMVVDPSACDASRFADLIARSRTVPPTAALSMLDEALGLWRGPGLSALGDLGRFGGAAVHLDELRLEAEERRAAHLLALRREDEAVAGLVRLLDVAPERERARGLLMEALYRSGRHAEALRTYATWRHQLADERGLEPSPELRRLEADILNHRLPERPPLIDPDPVPAGQPPLEVPANTFVGRDEELDTVTRALSGSRLVTLIGPGGVGKTRLVVELCRRLTSRYPDGIWWCDLSGVADPAEVPLAVAIAGGLRQWTAARIEDQLVHRLRGRRCLVVLDNCEHVLEGAASLTARLTTAAVDVTVLATSRERLRVDGERLVAISPLAVDGERSPAVDLFCDRARAAGGEGCLQQAPASLIAAVCRKLDGLPLAIELAAARTRGLSIVELAEGLDESLQLLDLGPRCRVRHRSMRAVVDWSYDQLSIAERKAFERLCAFTDTFGMADAVALLGAVGVPATEVPHLVADLVERSLLARRGDHTLSRYSTLETLRIYALERLAERGELARVQAEHAGWALGLATQAAHGLDGVDERCWVDRLDDHFDDLRSAHRWFLRHDPEGAVRLGDALHPYAFWRTRSEVFSWMVAAVDAAGSSPAAPRLLASICAGAWQRGDLAAADAALSAAVAAVAAGESCDRRIIGQRGELALLRGWTDSAAHLFTQSAELARRDGDHLQAVWDLGSASLSLAYGGRQSAARACAAETIAVADRAGSPSARAFARFAAGEIESLASPAAALPLLRAAVELADSVDNTMVASLAGVAMATVVARLDPAAALRQHEGAILNWQRSRSWTSQWVTLRNVAVLLADVGRVEEAAMLHAAVVGGRPGVRPFGRDREVLEALQRRLVASLGPDRLTVLAQRSAELTDDDVVTLAVDAIRQVSSAGGRLQGGGGVAAEP